MEIRNKSAYFHYAIQQKFTAGIVLIGSEVKSIRLGKASFNDSYCAFINDELWIKNLYIAAYERANAFIIPNPTEDRKLLLNRSELRKLHNSVKEKGISIVPLRIFFSEKNKIKVEIALAKGKKVADKRESIKERESKRYIAKFIRR